MSVLGGPLGGGGLPLAVVGLPDLSNGNLLGVLGVGGLQHSQDGLDHELSVQGGHPVGINRLRADLAGVRLHTRVVNLRHELDLRGLERVVVREVKVHRELATDERSSLRTVDDHVPDCHVVFSRLNLDASDRGSVEVTEFLQTANQLA